jgi:hypothetical protein
VSKTVSPLFSASPTLKAGSRIPDFNKRSLRLSDLHRICDELSIQVVQWQMRRLHGSAYEEDGYRFIYINPLISYSEQIVAGFHELEHIVSHVGNGEVCQSRGDTLRLSKQEKQAQMVGVIALMPITIVYGMTVEEMMREFDAPRKLAEFRFKIFQEYRR